MDDYQKQTTPGIGAMPGTPDQNTPDESSEMTELAALHLVFASASTSWMGMTSATPNTGVVSKMQKAITLIGDLITRVEAATENPDKTIFMAEQALAEHGQVVAFYVQAEDVRELLVGAGLADFSERLSDVQVTYAIESVVGHTEPPMGWDDWRADVEWRSARALAEQHGEPFNP